jgi:hypothetical protein
MVTSYAHLLILTKESRLKREWDGEGGGTVYYGILAVCPLNSFTQFDSLRQWAWSNVDKIMNSSPQTNKWTNTHLRKSVGLIGSLKPKSVSCPTHIHTCFIQEHVKVGRWFCHFDCIHSEIKLKSVTQWVFITIILYFPSRKAKITPILWKIQELNLL